MIIVEIVFKIKNNFLLGILSQVKPDVEFFWEIGSPTENICLSIFLVVGICGPAPNILQKIRFAKWCMMLWRANMKLCRSMYKQSAIVLATTVHLLYLLSTSYKYVLLTIYGLIVKMDHWTDRVLGKSDSNQSGIQVLVDVLNSYF